MGMKLIKIKSEKGSSLCTVEGCLLPEETQKEIVENKKVRGNKGSGTKEGES